MSKKSLFSLMLICLVLVGLYLISGDKRSSSTKSGSRPLLFAHVGWENVKSIELEKDGKSLTLDLSEEKGGWVIPARNDYAASSSSIRSFLLKLMDLSTSQFVEGTEEGIRKLGLSADSKESGQGSITLKDAAGKIIDKLFIGGLRTRKNETPENLMKLSGQYIKLESRPDIFLIPLPLTFQTDASAWLETAIVSIKPSNVFRVRVEGADQKEVFQLSRNSSILDEKEPSFSLSVSPPEGKEVQDTSVRQLALALEDLRLEDVRKHDADDVRAFSPSSYIKYELTNGSVYLLGTQELDGVAYLKVSVARDDKLVAELKELYAKEKELWTKKQEEQNKADSESKAKTENESAESASKTVTEEKQSSEKQKTLAELVIVTDEQIKAENDRLSPWIYIVPDFVAKKFSKDTADLFRELPAKSAVDSQ